jgi:hypothetical protein
VSRFSGEGSGPGAARTLRRWLPYAGMTRIRFEGFSRRSSQCVKHTPSRFSLYDYGRGVSKIDESAGGRADKCGVQICTTCTSLKEPR